MKKKLVLLLRVKDGIFFVHEWLSCYEKLVDEIVVVDNGSTNAAGRRARLPRREGPALWSSAPSTGSGGRRAKRAGAYRAPGRAANGRRSALEGHTDIGVPSCLGASNRRLRGTHGPAHLLERCHGSKPNS